MYMKVKQAAKKWGISERRVRVLCLEGKISRVFQDGRIWKIPLDASKPSDDRMKKIKSLLPLIEEK